MTKYTENRISVQLCKFVEIMLILGGLSCFVLLSMVQINWPYDLDHAIFAYIGDIIISGGLPYKDAWALKGPAVYYIFALVNWIFGIHEWGIRVFDMLLVILGLLAFRHLCAKISNNIIAWVFTFALGSLYFRDHITSAQPDGWISLLMIVMLVALTADKSRLVMKTAVSGGILLAIIGAIKPPYLLYCLVIVTYTLLCRGKTHMERLKFLSISALVTIIILTLIILFFWYNNALSSLVEHVFLYNIKYHRSFFWYALEDSFYEHIMEILARMSTLLPFLCSVAGFVFMWQDKRQETIIYSSWIACSVLLMILQDNYFLYHFLLVFPPIFIFGAYCLVKIREVFGRVVLYSLCFLALLGAYYGRYILYFAPTVDLYTGKLSRDEYNSAVNSYVPIRDTTAQRTISGYINEHGTQGSPVYVLGFGSLVNLLSGRPSPTDIIHAMPFIETHGRVFDEYSVRFMDDMKSNMPEYFIIATKTLKTVKLKNTKDYHPIYRIKGLKKFLDSNYRMEEVIDEYQIFKMHDDKVCYFENKPDPFGYHIIGYWYNVLTEMHKSKLQETEDMLHNKVQ